jgi:hypothetical protein
MFSAMKTQLDHSSPQVVRSRADVDVTSKARVCASVLAEARRLADSGNFGPLLNQLVARACELLDDVDEILVTLDPVGEASGFATAARLHRELEQIQALIPTRWRARVAPAPSLRAP